MFIELESEQPLQLISEIYTDPFSLSEIYIICDWSWWWYTLRRVPFSAIVEIKAGTWDGCMPHRDKPFNKRCNFSNFNLIIQKVLLGVSNETKSPILCLLHWILAVVHFWLQLKLKNWKMEFWWTSHAFLHHRFLHETCGFQWGELKTWHSE